MRTIVGIQARIGSSRLPGKVLKDVCGKSLIQRVWEACEGPWERCVLIPDTEENDELAAHLHKIGVWYERGSEESPLLRYTSLAARAKPKCLVRVCGDAPLLRPAWIRLAVDSRRPILIESALHSAGWKFWVRSLDGASSEDMEHAGHFWFRDRCTVLDKVVPSSYRMVNTEEDLEEVRRRFATS